MVDNVVIYIYIIKVRFVDMKFTLRYYTRPVSQCFFRVIFLPRVLSLLHLLCPPAIFESYRNRQLVAVPNDNVILQVSICINFYETKAESCDFFFLLCKTCDEGTGSN